MFKYTKHNLKKLEELFKELKYTIRYEKGNFQSGYCIVQDQNVAVINRFFDTDARINTLLEILSSIEVDVEQLDEKSAKLYLELEKRASEKSEQPSN